MDIEVAVSSTATAAISWCAAQTFCCAHCEKGEMNVDLEFSKITCSFIKRTNHCTTARFPNIIPTQPKLHAGTVATVQIEIRKRVTKSPKSNNRLQETKPGKGGDKTWQQAGEEPPPVAPTQTSSKRFSQRTSARSRN